MVFIIVIDVILIVLTLTIALEKLLVVWSLRGTDVKQTIHDPRSTGWRGNTTIPSNKPIPSSRQSLFQNECEVLLLQLVLTSIWLKTDIRNKDFALRLVLKERLRGTRRWPIGWIVTSTEWSDADYRRSQSRGMREVEKCDWFLFFLLLSDPGVQLSLDR